MKHEDAIEILKKHFNITQLWASEFPIGPVTITMRDGSFFCWYDAFYVADKDTGVVYVFTEHYGYHDFEGELTVRSNGPMKPKKTKPKGESNGI